MKSPWTTDYVDELRELWPSHSAREIAKKFGGPFTRNSVIGKARRIGLAQKRPTPTPKWTWADVK